MSSGNQDYNEIDLSSSLESDTGVDFGEESIEPLSEVSEPSGIMQWTIEHSGGLIKNKQQALYILLGVVGLSVLVSLYLLFGISGGGAEITAPPGNEVLYPPDEPPRLRTPLVE